jgi:heterodisulfide reductase subunit B
MKYAYFPGCSLESSAYDYDRSARSVCRALGVTLEEIHDWNCCGTTSVTSVDPVATAVMCARNLSLAEETGSDVVAACSSCYCMLARALELFTNDPKTRRLIQESLAAGGRSLTGKIKVKHLLEVFAGDLGATLVKARVQKPLAGLKVASYYGCMIVRPKGAFDDPEQPTSMDDLMTWLGAEPVRFDRKTKCCGGALMTTKEKSALRLNEELLYEATARGADVIAVACPMCLLNLDAYQDKINAAFKTSYKMPIMYFTQLMGLAFGLDKRADLAIGKTTVSHAKVASI